MERCVLPQERRWSLRVAAAYLWTLAVASFAVIASLAVERLRGCSLMAYGNSGGHFNIGGCVASEVSRMVPKSLASSFPIFALVAALGVVLFMGVGKCVRDGTSLAKWLTWAFVLVVVPLAVLPNGIYDLSVFWAAAAVPASALFLRPFYWRVVELLAVSAISMFCWFYPIVG